jgi:MFS family permease
MLFLAHRGMSLVEIGLLESIFHLTGMIMEVPTGFIADRYGRRTSRILGRVIAFIGCLIMVGTHSFSGFAVSFVLQALSYNLESGAGEALIYDSLVQSGKEEEYMKFRGRNEIFFQLAQMLSLLIGGAVATYSYDLAYIITALINLAAIFISFSFEEPQISKTQSGESLFKHMKQSLNAVWDNRGVLPYVFHLEVFSLYYTTLHFYFQNFMKDNGHAEYQIGLILAAASVLGALTALVSYRIEKLLGEKNVIILTGILPGILFTVIAVTRAETVSLIMLSAVEGLMFVVFGDYINKLIPSEYRATLLSFEAMIFSIMMIGFFPVFGYISQNYGFKTAFGLTAIMSVITGCLTAISLFRKNRTVWSAQRN